MKISRIDSASLDRFQDKLTAQLKLKQIMDDLIKALIENEIASGRADALDIINCMKQEVKDGEDIQDVLSQYDLDLDYAIALF